MTWKWLSSVFGWGQRSISLTHRTLLIEFPEGHIWGERCAFVFTTSETFSVYQHHAQFVGRMDALLRRSYMKHEGTTQWKQVRHGVTAGGFPEMLSGWRLWLHVESKHGLLGVAEGRLHHQTVGQRTVRPLNLQPWLLHFVIFDYETFPKQWGVTDATSG